MTTDLIMAMMRECENSSSSNNNTFFFFFILRRMGKSKALARLRASCYEFSTTCA